MRRRGLHGAVLPSTLPSTSLTVALVAALCCSARASELLDPQVTTLAGTGVSGYQNGAGFIAQFDEPEGAVLSPDGSTLYVADTHNHRVRGIATASGNVYTLAGNGAQGHTDGVGAAVSFNMPKGLAITGDGSIMYVADMDNHRIRMITMATQTVSTIAGNSNTTHADGIGTSAHFHKPHGLAVTPDGTMLYVAERAAWRIRRIHLSTSPWYTVTTIAGCGNASEEGSGEGSEWRDGIGTNACFNQPHDLAISPDGAYLYVSDTANHMIRRVDLSTRSVVTIAGSGSQGCVSSSGVSSSPPLPYHPLVTRGAPVTRGRCSNSFGVSSTFDRPRESARLDPHHRPIPDLLPSALARGPVPVLLPSLPPCLPVPPLGLPRGLWVETAPPQAGSSSTVTAPRFSLPPAETTASASTTLAPQR